jgi:FADH2 O2-dependent halogenase
MASQEFDADVVIIGGGPAGSSLATLLARDGRRVILFEKDIHPRHHVGEALTPSTTAVFERLGVLDAIEEEGFSRKLGVCWTAPTSRPDQFFSVRTSDFRVEGSPRPYSFNVERGMFDALLLKHAHTSGARIVQGVTVQRVLFEDERAVGVHVSVTDGWERDVRAPFVIDASGRRCLLANQLHLRRRDPDFNQFSFYSWFRNVSAPQEYQDFLFLHFLGLERAWGWQIPLRNGVTSVGVITDKRDFKKSGRSYSDFFDVLLGHSAPFRTAMSGTERIRAWWVEGDYSYTMDQFSGQGWLLIGDAFRFVDPIFSSGVDVALYSAMFAYEALSRVWGGTSEGDAFDWYGHQVGEGVDVWYQLTDLSYRMPLLFTLFIISRKHRADLVRVLQGNPYLPETQVKARAIIAQMWEVYERRLRGNRVLAPSGLIVPPQRAAGSSSSA